MSAEEDITLPYKYGPLIECGMSLKEIRAHTEAEIKVMLKSLNRWRIINNAYGMSDEMKKDINNRLLWEKYVDETEKYKRQVRKDGVDEESKFGESHTKQ